MTLAIVLLVVGLAVGAGIGYFAMPDKGVQTPPTYPVSPVYSKALPTDMSHVAQYSTGGYVIFVWSQGSVVYWTYAKVGG
jgi:hypothetical protein